MDFSKPVPPKLISTNINKAIEEAIELSSVSMRKRGIDIQKDLDVNLPTCRADPHLIEEVILNLITNAAETMKDIDGARYL
jgi:signal transduction histidine kinase